MIYVCRIVLKQFAFKCLFTWFEVFLALCIILMLAVEEWSYCTEKQRESLLHTTLWLLLQPPARVCVCLRLTFKGCPIEQHLLQFSVLSVSLSLLHFQNLQSKPQTISLESYYKPVNPTFPHTHTYTSSIQEAKPDIFNSVWPHKSHGTVGVNQAHITPNINKHSSPHLQSTNQTLHSYSRWFSASRDDRQPFHSYWITYLGALHSVGLSADRGVWRS